MPEFLPYARVATWFVDFFENSDGKDYLSASWNDDERRSDTPHQCWQAVFLSEFTKRLENGGSTHTSYYHYTNWDAFSKMMTKVKCGPAQGLRVLLLTPAYNTNDKIERCWGEECLSCVTTETAGVPLPRMS
ncbi:MAG: hypothetical protein IJR99_06630 [Kiritimatiellae bacterium]|nr:hypothetical protein [Kiritimatiellia bacterium]